MADPEAVEKMREVGRRAAIKNQPWKYAKNQAKNLKHYKGSQNVLWKGDSASYSAKHHWIANNYGKPEVCQICRRTGLKGRAINWANISDKYVRDRKDWLRLCRKCHACFDATKRILKRHNDWIKTTQ